MNLNTLLNPINTVRNIMQTYKNRISFIAMDYWWVKKLVITGWEEDLLYATKGRFRQLKLSLHPNYNQHYGMWRSILNHTNWVLLICSDFESLHGIFNKENTMTVVCRYEAASCMQLER